MEESAADGLVDPRIRWYTLPYGGRLVLLEGRVAVVTGASSGIGREIAEVFAAEGARVVGFDRAERPGEELVQALEGRGAPRPRFIGGDVRNPQEVEAAAATVVAETGRIDILVNCAGVREICDVYEMTSEEWNNVLAINLSGVFYWCQSAARLMRDAGGGSIINISSVAGLIGFSRRPAYTATKHAVIGLTKSLARDLAPAAIRVNAICPGLIRTPLTESYFQDEHFQEELALVVPQGRYGEANDVAQAALYLASDMASYVNGIALTVDGGWLAEKSFVMTDASKSAFYRPHGTAS
jgi:meso-butanediol dehydrogenase / (S,S)-butanediol dehydrogenase / diacetyl reductase